MQRIDDGVVDLRYEIIILAFGHDGEEDDAIVLERLFSSSTCYANEEAAY